MKKISLLFLLALVLFTGCKSNQEAYNLAFRNLKDKEEAMATNARTAMDVPKNTTTSDSAGVYQSEQFTLVMGRTENLSEYNIVARSFINRTNARGFYTQMADKGYNAALVQNEEMMYRIIIASYINKEEAEKNLKDIQATYPEAYILIKK
jgi:cell division protein FtsN